MIPMLLKKLLIAYLCLFFATSSSPLMADYGAAPSSSGDSDQGVGTYPERSSPLLLGSSSEYASDFGTEGSSIVSQPSPTSRMTTPSTKEGVGNIGRGSEYISGYYKGAVLMPVRLWGAVRQTGLHQIPTGTDLLQLLSLAGGPNVDAKLDDVTIRRFNKDGAKIIKVDLMELIDSKTAKIQELEANDIVILPATQPVISGNTVAIIGVVSSVLGIVSASILVANALKKNN